MPVVFVQFSAWKGLFGLHFFAGWVGHSSPFSLLFEFCSLDLARLHLWHTRRSPLQYITTYHTNSISLESVIIPLVSISLAGQVFPPAPLLLLSRIKKFQKSYLQSISISPMTHAVNHRYYRSQRSLLSLFRDLLSSHQSLSPFTKPIAFNNLILISFLFLYPHPGSRYLIKNEVKKPRLRCQFGHVPQSSN